MRNLHSDVWPLHAQNDKNSGEIVTSSDEVLTLRPGLAVRILDGRYHFNILSQAGHCLPQWGNPC